MSSSSLSLTLRDSWKRTFEAKGVSEEPTVVPSDEYLMALVQKGDDEAFGELFERFYVTVRGIARGVLRNSDDAAEVVQEAFLDVFKNAYSFDRSRGATKTWICCLAYHRSLKRLRALKAREWQAVDAEGAAANVEGDFRPDQLIHSLDFRNCLEKVLGTLSEKHRRSVGLQLFGGQR